MSFQRSYSKVWWGSDSQQQTGSSSNISSFTSGGLYSHYNYKVGNQQLAHSQSESQQQQPASLDSALQRHLGQQAGNLSSIQEVDDEQNSSKMSWHKHDSPGSLRSQVRYQNICTYIFQQTLKMQIKRACSQFHKRSVFYFLLFLFNLTQKRFHSNVLFAFDDLLLNI